MIYKSDLSFVSFYLQEKFLHVLLIYTYVRIRDPRTNNDRSWLRNPGPARFKKEV